jgi:nitroreductase
MTTDVDEKNSLNAAAAGIQYPLHPLISARKSPRAFTQQPVEPEKVRSVLEAARWAPSASNMQPWQFIVAAKDRPEDYERMLNLLFDGNRTWAAKAPVLILSVAQVTDPASRKANKFAFHDVGLATENLALQAVSLGLAVHAMGGFDADRANASFNIPDEFEPVAVIALGYEGGAEFLPQPLLERELAPRVRKPLSEFVFGNIWGASAPAVENERTNNLNTTINN